MITPEELAEVERLDREATPGPWQVNRFDNDGGEINWQVQQVPRPSEEDEAHVVIEIPTSKIVVDAKQLLRALRALGVEQ